MLVLKDVRQSQSVREPWHPEPARTAEAINKQQRTPSQPNIACSDPQMRRQKGGLQA
jgi:hypothetical protein